MKTCKSCGAAVRWAKTNNGKPTLLDDAPSGAGNVALLPVQVHDGRLSVAVVLNGESLEQARAGDAELRTAHFATCPHADEHRKKKAA